MSKKLITQIDDFLTNNIVVTIAIGYYLFLIVILLIRWLSPYVKDNNDFTIVLNIINIVVIFATFLAIFLYTLETKDLKKIQKKQLEHQQESNLRPVILRSGWISKWEDIKFSIKNGQLKGQPLQFTILKNIAKDISGYIIINKNKYNLLFANEISQINEKDSLTLLSDLEKRIMIHLYEIYTKTKMNSKWKISEAKQTLDIKEGEYMGTLNSSRYIRIIDDEFRLTNDGIRFMDSEKPKAFQFLPSWGWMNAGTKINAIFESGKYKETQEENQIYLTYTDMGENKYFTRENKDFSQSSGKL
ncbi:MAG: hypothetical protein COU29_03330 [Candidatus Magasanikbacteria bacterium CG10_big_fil_rev_8_21_14_0_10_36_32]|uniref:Uncharacterized protein n=1 Tax=Candidatus Magasanikbacteria bacterium CG10_big_fil_rev_8_21_14_0_10_36_32 TaxID=1974646 RepID=A0A2M6W635_9BACT|nr:MAG: hypothetical protein COU29_03330 [Candidatus Magasanikbacteria bacterium CG10_big_fil_rev_8_21_14_0_10_36_32]